MKNTGRGELRQNNISGDWILISPGRGRRPHEFKETRTRKRSPINSCPFENPNKAGGGGVIFSDPAGDDWKLQIVPNRYPAVQTEGIWVLDKEDRGPFTVLPGYGYHELLITRDHDDNFAAISKDEAHRVFEAFRSRYKILALDKNLSYISLFHNWGEKAGASIYHPHYQLLGVPVIPPGVHRSLSGASAYYKKFKTCAHCSQNAWELKKKTRVVYSNDKAVVFVPFASKEPFEMRVFPKRHTSFFEETDTTTMRAVVDALQVALRRLEKGLKKPDYNFFIHTSPTQNKRAYKHYHWHVELVPQTNVSAGFELGTDMQINPLDPDEAAAFLRRHAK